MPPKKKHIAQWDMIFTTQGDRPLFFSKGVGGRGGWGRGVGLVVFWGLKMFF